jgi:hypothetical protein
MKRRLLTKHQTIILQSIIDTIKQKTGLDVLVTDFLDACLYKSIMTLISEKVVIIKNDTAAQLQLNKLKRECKVYKGNVLSNGLHYKVIIAIKNKDELCKLFNIERLYDDWEITNNKIHIEVATREPGEFYACPEPKKGRPSIDNYFTITNVTPIKYEIR